MKPDCYTHFIKLFFIYLVESFVCILKLRSNFRLGHIFCKLDSFVSSRQLPRCNRPRFRHRLYGLPHILSIRLSLLQLFLGLLPFLAANVGAESAHLLRRHLLFHHFEFFKWIRFKIRLLTHCVAILLFVFVLLLVTVLRFFHLIICHIRWLGLLAPYLVVFCVASKLLLISICWYTFWCRRYGKLRRMSTDCINLGKHLLLLLKQHHLLLHHLNL